MTEKILKALYFNDLKIGDEIFKASVLEDKTRVLTRATFIKAIGRTGKAKGGRAYDDEFKMPVFLTANNLKPFIPNDLMENSAYVGKLTNSLIYEKLPPGVLEELKNKNPKDDKGRRKHRHHQFLTDDIGNPHLEKQLVAVTTLLKVAPKWASFKRNFARAFPDGPEQSEMEFLEDEKDI